MENKQNILVESPEALRRYAEELMNDSDDENESTLNLLKEHMKYYRNAQARFQAMEQCTTQTIEKIKGAKNESEIDELFAAYDRDMKNAKNLDVPVNDATYQEFLSMLGKYTKYKP